MRSPSRHDREGVAVRNTRPPPPEYAELPRDEWQQFCDRMSSVLRGRSVEVEVVGLDVGDQIALASVQLTGLSYVPEEDTLRIHAEGRTSHVAHTIEHPHEIHFLLGVSGLEVVAVITQDGRTEFLRLRTPLALPRHDSRPRR